MTWQSHAIALLSASLVRPLALAAAAWVILRVFKVRHPASRHAAWSAVLAGMLLLPVASVIAPHWKLPLLPRGESTAMQTRSQTDDASGFDFSGFVTSAVPSASVARLNPRAKVFEWPAPGTMLLWGYLAGVLAMVGYRVAGWMMLARVMSRSKALCLGRVRESSDVLTPVTVGVLRPSVILPSGWMSWQASTRRAVLAHEFAHIRRGDTWVSFLTRAAKCVYWFHPLAWWISRQIGDLAELSCDAVVVEKNGDPGGYSRILLGFAETVNAAGYRAALPGLAIASRSGMGDRIDQVFELAGGNLRRLSRPGTVLALLGLPVMCVAAVVGLTAPAVHVLQQAAVSVTPSQPIVVAQLQTSPSAPAKPIAASRPKFDVVSIRLGGCVDLPGGRGSGSSAKITFSPGRVNIQCMNVENIINQAYVVDSDDPLANDFQVRVPDSDNSHRIRGGADWVRSGRYSIEAQTDDASANGPTSGVTPATGIMRLMLQTLLEDRFGLKIHRGEEEIPVYLLTVAKSGLKLKPMEEGGCTPIDPAVPPVRPVPGGKPLCVGAFARKEGNWIVTVAGKSPRQISESFSAWVLDRPVVDKTGINSLFSFRVEFAQDENARGSIAPAPSALATADTPPRPSIFTVFEQQLGLKLTPDKGPHGFIVIDSVEQPSEN